MKHYKRWPASVINWKRQYQYAWLCRAAVKQRLEQSRVADTASTPQSPASG